MTRYTVLWDSAVENQFIDAWCQGDRQVRAILTEAANWVDENLAESPNQKGQVRDDLSARVLAIPVSNSLARVSVTYQILEEDRQVRIIRFVFKT